MTICSMGVDLSHVDSQTDGQDKGNSCSSQFCKLT